MGVGGCGTTLQTVDDYDFGGLFDPTITEFQYDPSTAYKGYSGIGTDEGQAPLFTEDYEIDWTKFGND